MYDSVMGTSFVVNRGILLENRFGIKVNEVLYPAFDKELGTQHINVVSPRDTLDSQEKCATLGTYCSYTSPHPIYWK
jgi:hypothetical protein